MVQRISNLPDGCNRIDEPWTREHINGYEYDEYGGPCHYVHHEIITKENFIFFFEDEIEEQQKFDEFIEDYFDDSIKLQEGGNEMIRQNILHVPSEDKIEYCFHGLNMETCIGCGECKTVLGWTPEGALSGKPTILRTLEETRDLKRMEKAQSWKEFSKETHQLINDMKFIRAIGTSPSREISIDFDEKDYIIDDEIIFERKAQGIDEPTIIDELFF